MLKITRYLLDRSWGVVLLTSLLSVTSGLVYASALNALNRALRDAAVRLDSVATFAAFALVAELLGYCSRLMVGRVATQSMTFVRMDIARRLAALPIRRFEDIGATQLIAGLVRDVDILDESFVELPKVIGAGATIFACLCYLFVVSSKLMLIVLGPFVLTVASLRIIPIKAHAMSRLATEIEERVIDHFQDLTEGAKELKLQRDRRIQLVETEIARTLARKSRTDFATTAWWGAADLWQNLGLLIGIAAVLLLGHRAHVETSQISAFVLTLLFFGGPVGTLSRSAGLLVRAGESARHIESFGISLDDSKGDLATTSDPIRLDWKTLRLRNLTHRYRSEIDRQFTLGPIDLVLTAGQLVFIVGGNGSGKSTLGKLITGLYTPESGEIWMDDTRIDDGNRDWYRQHFGAVFSDYYLFREFVAVGPEKRDAIVERHLKGLGLAHKVDVKDGRLSTTKLSQGQRKRLALLSTFVEDRPICLFDEWAADQDPEFKDIFYREILPEMRRRGKTVLVITHDDRYFDTADLVIKIEAGQIVESRTVRIAS